MRNNLFFDISTENPCPFAELLFKLPAECMQTKLEVFINLIACESSQNTQEHHSPFASQSFNH